MASKHRAAKEKRRPASRESAAAPGWLEAFNVGTEVVFERVFTPALQLHRHDGFIPGPASGIEAIAAVVSALRAGFPDLRLRIDRMHGQGQTHAAWWTARGTHAGTFVNLAPTGREVSWRGQLIARAEANRIAELWLRLGVQAILMQLGMNPGAS